MKRAFPVMAVLFCCMIFCMTGCGSSEKSDSGAKEEKTVKKQEQQNEKEEEKDLFFFGKKGDKKNSRWSLILSGVFYAYSSNE